MTLAVDSWQFSLTGRLDVAMGYVLGAMRIVPSISYVTFIFVIFSPACICCTFYMLFQWAA